MKELLEVYRQAKLDTKKAVAKEFPVGTRVRPVGVTAANCRGTVNSMSEQNRRQLAADHILVAWDDGYRFSVAVDSIERCGDRPE